MEKLEKEWTKHPILHFDLNISHYDAPDSLYKILNDTLSRYEEEYGTRPTEETLPLRFAGIIDRAYRKTGQRAVILIDEYDKPLLQNLHDEEMQNRLRNMLKPFYGVLKTMDRAIRFALLTGVTKFGKVSVFSDLNNLDGPINATNAYVEICGITEKRSCIRISMRTSPYELAVCARCGHARRPDPLAHGNGTTAIISWPGATGYL